MLEVKMMANGKTEIIKKTIEVMMTMAMTMIMEIDMTAKTITIELYKV